MPINSRAWLAPAKLNLFLHVLGRRQDGMHLLQTVFQFVDLYDELEFEVNRSGLITRHYTLEGVEASKDIVVKAARAMQQEGGDRSRGVDIRLKKRIPMGGGLGGGSSDAATALVALNRLWSLHLPPQRLAEMALDLGADVPVFVQGHAAWAEGIGEKLTRLHSLPEPWYLIIVPQVHVSTRAVFSHRELTRNSDAIKIRDFLQGKGHNVCEPVVFALHPEVAEAAQWLSKFGRTRMSGTGAAVFCPFEREQDAKQASSQKPKNWQGFVVKGLNQSPLVESGDKD